MNFLYEKLKQLWKHFVVYAVLDVDDFGDILIVIDSCLIRRSCAEQGEKEKVGKRHLGPARCFSVQNELLLTLVKLRHVFPESGFVCRFRIS